MFRFEFSFQFYACGACMREHVFASANCHRDMVVELIVYKAENQENRVAGMKWRIRLILQFTTANLLRKQICLSLCIFI